MKAIGDVSKAFHDDSFVENADTPYEVLILPDELPESGFIGVAALEVEFTIGGFPNDLRTRQIRI